MPGHRAPQISTVYKYDCTITCPTAAGGLSEVPEADPSTCPKAWLKSGQGLRRYGTASLGEGRLRGCGIYTSCDKYNKVPPEWALEADLQTEAVKSKGRCEPVK